MQRRILLSEDPDRTYLALQPVLEAAHDVQIDRVSTTPAALRALAENNYSLFLLDLLLPGMGGMKLLAEIQRQSYPVSVIVQAQRGSIDLAVQAMRLGAADFFTKPIDVQRLGLAVQRVLRERRLQDERASLHEQLQHQAKFGSIISKNPRMHAIFALIHDVAQTNSTVLIEGETGTGKEQIARALHQAAQLRSGPLVAVNCAALPANLLESELFGHERGAFTSAVSQRAGRFELAHGGTIFLDEVGDIPASMQAKLLRVLQERRFERVGGTESIDVDVRVVAATNRSLKQLVQEGKFREDLYYRLNVVKIELPPLRERREDIPLLAAFFAEKYARPGQPPQDIPFGTMNLLMDYAWPGNIRELENAIERACVTSRDGVLLPVSLPPDLLRAEKRPAPCRVSLDQPLPALLKQVQAGLEQEYLRRALERSRGNINRCAKLCGISRRSLSTKLGAYQIDKMVFKEFAEADA